MPVKDKSLEHPRSVQYGSRQKVENPPSYTFHHDVRVRHGVRVPRHQSTFHHAGLFGDLGAKAWVVGVAKPSRDLDVCRGSWTSPSAAWVVGIEYFNVVQSVSGSVARQAKNGEAKVARH